MSPDGLFPKKERASGPSVLKEYEAFCEERFEFLVSELVHMETMGRTEPREDPFFEALGVRKDGVLRIIDDAQGRVGTLCAADSMDWEAAQEYNRIELLFELLPSCLADTAQGFLNRRPLSYVSPLTPRKNPGQRFSLSSVHPAYASSILALECVGSAIHDKLRPFYGTGFDHPHPLLTLWTASRYYSSGIEDVVPIRDDPEHMMLHGHLIRVSDLLHLLSFGLPRWACHHLRISGPTLAHEHCHHVILLTRFCLKYRAEFKDEEPYLSTKFGEHIVELSQAFNDLTEMLKKFLRSNEDNHAWREIEIVDEFLSDVGACTLVGPAFPYALAVLLLPTLARDPSYIHLRHPLPYVRLVLLTEILKYLNMPEAARKTEEMVEPIRNFVLSKVYREEVGQFCDDYLAWIKSDEVMEFFRRFCILFAGVVDSGTHEDRPIGFKSMMFQDPSGEAMWNRALRYLTGMISGEDPQYGLDGGMFAPTDILNALWLAKQDAYSSSDGKITQQPFQLAWRMWLTNYTRKCAVGREA